MGFLDAGCDCASYMDFDVGGTFGKASTFSQKNDASHTDSICFFDGGEDIARLAARGEPDEDIPRFAEGADLAGEDVLAAYTPEVRRETLELNEALPIADE